jgi:hypothetical protein
LLFNTKVLTIIPKVVKECSLNVVVLVLMNALPLELTYICYGDTNVACWFHLLYFTILRLKRALGVPLDKRPQGAGRKKNINRWPDMTSDGLVLVKELMRKNRVEESSFLSNQIRFGFN